MVCNAYASSSLESRRREISQLLEEIRAPLPTPTEIIKAIEQASEGRLEHRASGSDRNRYPFALPGEVTAFGRSFSA